MSPLPWTLESFFSTLGAEGRHELRFDSLPGHDSLPLADVGLDPKPAKGRLMVFGSSVVLIIYGYRFCSAHPLAGGVLVLCLIDSLRNSQPVEEPLLLELLL